MAPYKGPRGWYEFKNYNIRELLEKLEAEGLGTSPTSSEINLVFILSALNALREGLLEIKKRIDKLEKTPG